VYAKDVCRGVNRPVAGKPGPSLENPRGSLRKQSCLCTALFPFRVSVAATRIQKVRLYGLASEPVATGPAVLALLNSARQSRTALLDAGALLSDAFDVVGFRVEDGEKATTVFADLRYKAASRATALSAALGLPRELQVEVEMEYSLAPFPSYAVLSAASRGTSPPKNNPKTPNRSWRSGRWRRASTESRSSASMRGVAGRRGGCLPFGNPTRLHPTLRRETRRSQNPQAPGPSQVVHRLRRRSKAKRGQGRAARRCRRRNRVGRGRDGRGREGDAEVRKSRKTTASFANDVVRPGAVDDERGDTGGRSACVKKARREVHAS
jgi:hypothetical protein